MPSLPLGDEDIANALTFVYNSFGNSGKVVAPEEVKAMRGQTDTDAPGQREVAHVT
jgi:mono/diheme cytochrome c family protein